ncbi:MAG: hypothetical protein ACQSGP_17830 [Frankia sp.]
MQAFLLGVLTRQARFARNPRILAAVERELAAGDGAGPDAPDAAQLLAAARAQRAERAPGSRLDNDAVD